jgi:hypothetical protein
MLTIALALAITAHNADPACPCRVDPLADLSNGTHIRVSLGKGLAPFQLYDLPAEHGSAHCSAYDSTMAGSCAEADGTPKAGRPLWCGRAWCYVDQEKCKHSTFDFIRSENFPSRGLFFSYRTCGSGSEFFSEHNPRSLRGVEPYKRLTVAIPAMDFPMHFKRDPTTGAVATGTGPLYLDDSVPWEGSMINFLEGLRTYTMFGP